MSFPIQSKPVVSATPRSLLKLVLSVTLASSLTHQQGWTQTSSPSDAFRQSAKPITPEKPSALTYFSESEKAVYASTIQFLKRMGFEDFSEMARQTLATNPDLSEMKKTLLIENQSKLDTINSARDLSAFIITRASNRTNDPRLIENLGQLTARALNLGIKGLPDELPPEIANIKDSKEKDIAAEKFIRQYLEAAANQTVNDFRSDIMSVLYTVDEARELDLRQDEKFLADKQYLTELIQRIVLKKYTEFELSQARFFGRALTLTILRWARLNQRSDIERTLEKITLEHGEALSNFTTDQYILSTRNKKQPMQKISLQSGDLLMNYTLSQEENNSDIRYYPSGWTEKFIQFVRLHLGFQLNRHWLPLEQHILQKQMRGEKLTLRERAFNYIFNLPVYRRGYNTVGIVDIKVDAETGLKSAWIYRANTNSVAGGIQVEDIRNFIPPGFSERIGHFRFNVNALLENSKTESGESLFSHGASLSLNAEAKVAHFPAQFQSEDFAQLEQLVIEKNNDQILRETIAPKVIGVMKNMMVGQDVVGFNWGALAEKGLISSPQAVWVAYATGAGLQTQTAPDQAIVGSERSLQEKNTTKNVNIIAPSTWSWETDLGVYKKYELPRSSLEAKYLEFTYVTRPPIEMEMYSIANHGMKRLSIDDVNMHQISGQVQKFAEYQYLLAQPSTVETSQTNTDKKNKNTTISSMSKMTEPEMREFLVDLGFQDWEKQIQEKIDRKETWNEATATQQLRNLKSMSAFTAARELAVLLMSRTQSQLNTENGMQNMADLAGYLISLQPMNPIKKIPTEILDLSDEKQKAAMDKYVSDLTRQNMEEHTRIIVSDLLENIYGENMMQKIKNNQLSQEENTDIKATTKKIYDLTSTFVDRMYLDHQVGQTRFIGRAFLGLMARQAELRREPLLDQMLEKSLARHGVKIQNYIGDTWLLGSSKTDELQRVPVNTFSYVLTRNTNTESATIPWGAQPASELYERAKENELIGNPLSAALVVSADDLASGNYGVLQKFRDKKFYTWMNDGFSHIGYAVIKQARNSNVKMSWVIDNYPHPLADAEETIENTRFNAGGMRFVGLEQFFMTSHHTRVMVASIDPQEFYDYAMKHIAKHGVPKTGDKIFPYSTSKMKLDKNGKPQLQNDMDIVNWGWTVESSQEILNDLYTTKDPQEFYRKAQALITAKMEKNMERGMIFHWITPYGRYEEGGGYCSSSGVIAAIQAIGLTIEPQPSRWISLLHFLAKIYEQAKKWDLKFITENAQLKNFAKMAQMGIIAPSSLAAQSFVKTYHAVRAAIQDIRARTNDDWSFRVANSKDWRDVVEEKIPLSQVSNFSTGEFDPTEVRALSEDIIHTTEIKMGKIGIAFDSAKKYIDRLRKMDTTVLTKNLKEHEKEQERATKAVAKQRAADDRGGAVVRCSQVLGPAH